MIKFYLSIDKDDKVIGWHKSDCMAVHSASRGGSIQYVEGLILDGTPHVLNTIGKRIYYNEQGKRVWNIKS